MLRYLTSLWNNPYLWVFETVNNIQVESKVWIRPVKFFMDRDRKMNLKRHLPRKLKENFYVVTI